MRERSGIGLAAAVCLAVSVHVWLACGRLVPIGREPVEFAFVSASLGTFAAIILATFGGLGIVHAFVRLAGPDRPPWFSAADVAYAGPLLLLAGSLLGLLNLIPGAARYLAVLSYVVVDLRWWWTAAVGVWVIVRVDRRLGGALTQRMRRLVRVTPGWVGTATLAVGAATWVVVGTPNLDAFTPKIGDEPKYVRYCESFYQGLGFEMSDLKSMAELGAGYRPRVWRNVELIAATLPGTVRDVLTDAVARVRGEPGPGSTAQAAEAQFIVGRNGGLYQLHNPGLSMLIFPAYYLDRQSSEVDPSSRAQWPPRLQFLRWFLIALYVVWTVQLFRFLRLCTDSKLASGVATVAAMFTMPVAAFPLQVYPEIAAGLLILLAARAILFPSDAWRVRWIAVGLLAGYLPWLHVRFIGVAALLAVMACWRLRRDLPKAAGFAAGFLVPLACLSLYTYHVTGSLNPASGWVLQFSGEPLSLQGALRGGLAYLLDRDWGLLAHSPIFLLAFPGFYWLWRTRPTAAVLSALTVLTLTLTAGAHSLVAAGTTPMRLIVAVVPLLAIPMAALLARYGGNRALQVLTGFLLLLSLHTALAYNLHHEQSRMIDLSISGWKANLLFPADSRWPWQVSTANVLSMIGWIVVVAALSAAPWLVRKMRVQGSQGLAPARLTTAPALTGVLVATFIAIGTAASAAMNVWTADHYQMAPAAAATEAARLLDGLGHCAICAVSRDGRRLTTHEMLRRLEAVDPVVATRMPAEVPTSDYQAWLQMPGLIRQWYVEANGHEPGDADLGHYLYQWREDRVPPSEIRRRVFAAAGKPVPQTPREIGR